MARLFFAVWPDERAARALGELAQSLARSAEGRPVPIEKVHLTLAFLGEITVDEAVEAVEAAEALRARRFALALDRVGSFRQARVAWAGTTATPKALESLQSSLAAELRARGIGIEDRPFVPHVTLARRIARAVTPAPMAPIEWNAEELTLAQSEIGTGRYRVLERWPLG